ncbi:MAG: hypothetical protein AAGJ18_09825 [Bacteroidota bacterium]
MAYHLTEDNIKHATLSFLKSYYKNNSSRGFGETVATLDMQAGDGIIADGYIKFSIDHDPLEELSGKDAEKAVLEGKTETKKSRKSFLATFEATSQNTAQEIQYQVQNTLLFFDALAAASIVAAISYGYNYMNDQFTLNQLGTLKFFLGFLAVLIASTIIYILICRKFSRYHYIYALAQFKRYHADEQWVAYGEDVFANPNNKYLIELKKQCIRQGFGLISVDQDLQPSLVMTPARERTRKNKRKKLTFSASQIAHKKGFKWVSGLKVPKIKSPVDPKNYTRFTQSYWKQILTVLAMLFVIGEIYIVERKNPNIVYADEKEYTEELKKIAANKTEEPKEYLIIGEEKDIYQDGSEAIAKEVIKPEKKKAIVVPQKTNPKPKTAKLDALIISTGMNEYVSYGCSRLSAMKGTNFLVQIATATNRTSAIQKVIAFNERGFKANAVWLGCFLNKKIYVVYLDDIFDDKTKATERLEKYQRLLIAKKQNPKDAVLRAIQGTGGD